MSFKPLTSNPFPNQYDFFDYTLFKGVGFEAFWIETAVSASAPRYVRWDPPPNKFFILENFRYATDQGGTNFHLYVGSQGGTNIQVVQPFNLRRDSPVVAENTFTRITAPTSLGTLIRDISFFNTQVITESWRIIVQPGNPFTPILLELGKKSGTNAAIHLHFRWREVSPEFMLTLEEL